MVQRQGERRCGNQTTMPQASEAALVASVVDCHAGCIFEGYISNPVGKSKSVQFTEAGLQASERLCRERFAQ